MKLYTKTVCPKCILVKDSIKRLGFEDKVEIVNTDTDVVAKHEVVEMGLMTLPVFVVDGVVITNPTQINAYLHGLE